jgi:hypothetical protein
MTPQLPDRVMAATLRQELDDTEQFNLKKIGIDTDPSWLENLKDVFWVIEQFAVSVSC